MIRELLEEVDVRVRVIAGTEWPVRDQLWRTGRSRWEVVRELCNGVPRTTEIYRSEAAAREAFAARLDGAKPRAGAPATETVTVRATVDEKAAWKAAADAELLPLSDWIRAAAADRAKG
ncbi:MAG TPA: hypothetical protein VJU58_13875 [Microbacterium sp.]|nr:hypothetical protein [Microbacterium sp.]